MKTSLATLLAAATLAVSGGVPAQAAPTAVADLCPTLGCALMTPSEFTAGLLGADFFTNLNANAITGGYPITQWPPNDPVTGAAVSNGFPGDSRFDASQYAADCNTGLYIVNTPSYQYEIFEGSFPTGTYKTIPAVQIPICSVTAAPVVDTSFIGELTAKGLSYQIVYPPQDSGNGRAYIVWNNAIPANFHIGANMPTIAGYARITGVTWQNQFQPYDLAGQFIADQASPTSATTMRLAVAGLAATAGTYGAYYFATMLTDTWLGDTVILPPLAPPPQSLTPPVASTQSPTAGAINIGSSSTGAGSGANSGGLAFTANDAGFSWASYCNSPDSRGSMRSPLWIANCLAAAPAQ